MNARLRKINFCLDDDNPYLGYIDIFDTNTWTGALKCLFTKKTIKMILRDYGYVFRLEGDVIYYLNRDGDQEEIEVYLDHSKPLYYFDDWAWKIYDDDNI